MFRYRKYLKNPRTLSMILFRSAEQKGLPPPPIEKEYPSDAPLINLLSPKNFTLGSMPLLEAITKRKSRREYTDSPLTLEELSFLLWSTQGVKEIVANGRGTIRTVPSGGGMHPFETYLLVNRIEGIESGLYRYIATRHALLLLPRNTTDMKSAVNKAACGQAFVGDAAVVFIWSVRPSRTEWRYRTDSLKDILMSVGHICQNLYLACESINAGTCAIQAYDQKLLDSLAGVDGKEEITLYLAPVGKVE
jgi:SagB-type dehydrogenase family enzyme